jgi:5-methylcytosine-specific restriction endonuclease McrA
MNKYNSDKFRSKYAERKAAGLCAHCGRPKESQDVWCSKCKEAKKVQARNHRNRLISQGICTRCGKAPALPGQQDCRECKDKDALRCKERIKKLKGTGCCVICGKEKERKSIVLCNSCASKNTADDLDRRKERDSRGVCLICGDARVGEQKYCFKHYLMSMSQRNLGSTKYHQELLDKYNGQGGKCFYTGLPITIGTDASLDHIVPKSRGGKDEIGNLVWCLYRANMLKTDLLYSELVAICEAVVKVHREREVEQLERIYKA